MTNKTIIPSSVYAETTTAHTIVSGGGTADLSIMGYGMGWFRMSYRGHDVRMILTGKRHLAYVF